MLVYFPSCNFTRLRPDTSKRIKAYLQTTRGIEVSGCCRPNHTGLTDSDTAITVCQNCRTIIELNAPQSEHLSVWEFLDADADFPWPDYHGERIILQDCWRARGEMPVHDAVRSIMRKMNIEVVELDKTRENADFCGRFTCEDPGEIGDMQGIKYFMLPSYPPETLEQKMRERCEIYGAQRVVCYCNSCLMGLEQGGAAGVHLMELIMPE